MGSLQLVMRQNLTENSRPIAIVEGGPDNGKFLLISEDFGDEAIEIPMDSRFALLPEFRDKTAQHIHIVGPSGCGKSSTAQELAANHPGKRIVISADEEEDDNLLDIDGRIKADEDMDKINIDDLKHPEGTMVIFDDIEGVPKQISKPLNVFKRALHERGRKHGISTVNIYHRGADGESTRSSLAEMTHLVIFPQFANNQNTRYLLNKYAGLPENFCELLHNPVWGRRIMIAINDVPQYIIGEHAAAIINHTTIAALAKYQRNIMAKKIAASVQ